MLNSLEWIIPEETQDSMTSADWLIIVLAIYFHDLGMLVTRDEFEKRDKSAFPNFKKDILEGHLGVNFKDKITNIKDSQKQDRFVYQEFVRKTHAERIKYWILDESNPNFETADQVAEEIKRLIGSLSYMFRRDLAFVCESHHLSDLDNFEKYKLNQPYGSLPDEEANLHYAALILRTADLLHITSDRTPSIEYRLINPVDPISQDEWAKQKAVTKVRPQIKKNKEGKTDPTIEKDTLEVIALFEKENGFFGLIAYLNYADSELKLNYKYHEQACELLPSNYKYPWRKIDDSNIETKDFEKKQFEFTLDQTKILDLLVGHTLYNNQSVVLRELIQNSIDACRLEEINKKSSTIFYEPLIQVNWNSTDRQLSFVDNGTGMDIQIIQNHLLKVGSSRYQDENFKKEFPKFSPISRFGIGLLTCFLIADDIDIVTRTQKAEKAILLKIRKVHGKYLLKYLDVATSKVEIPSHGTKINLHVRPDVDLTNIESEIRKWIIIPSCNLILNNDGETTSIGYKTPEDVLRNFLLSNDYQLDEKKIKIVQKERNGLQLAYALRYIEHFKEWTFFDFRERYTEAFVPTGICVEGIRIDFNTPGFNGRNFLAIANSCGANAPKTNVARSNIETTTESDLMLKAIYEIYLDHIQEELSNLRKLGFSISWAAKEANYLLNSFVQGYRYSNNREAKLQNQQSFETALSLTNLILTEREKIRDIVNLNQLKEQGSFWTIDCASYTSADNLVKEVKGSNTSALSLMKTLFGDGDAKIDHIDNLLCGIDDGNVLDEIILDQFQVDTIMIIPEQRRLDLRWSSSSDKIWEKVRIESDRSGAICFIQLLDINLPNNIDQIAINSSSSFFILKNSELNTYLVNLIEKLSPLTGLNKSIFSRICGLVNNFFNHQDLDKSKVEEIIAYRFERNENRGLDRLIWDQVDKRELINVILKTNFVKYDTTIWSRRVSLNPPF